MLWYSVHHKLVASPTNASGQFLVFPSIYFLIVLLSECTILQEKKRLNYARHYCSPKSISRVPGRELNPDPTRSSSVADPGCLSRIPDPRFFHPGSRIRTVSIPDPGSSSKNLSILIPKKAKKWFLSSKKCDPGCSSRIPDPDADFLTSRIPGSKKHPIPDPGSGSATLRSRQVHHTPVLTYGTT